MDETMNQSDDTIPTTERHEALEAAYQANVAAGRPPYHDVAIRTNGELQWILLMRNWSSEPDLEEQTERVNLSGAGLWGADLSGMDLDGADLSDALVVGASFTSASLDGANLSGAFLEGADFSRVNAGGADFSGASLDRANLSGAYMEGADFSGAHMEEADLTDTYLAGTDFSSAVLEEADLSGAQLEWANLSSAYLKQSNLVKANLAGANLSGADLRECRWDKTTVLTDVTLSNMTRMADVIWNDLALMRVSWESMPTLGDESEAHRRIDENGKPRDRTARLTDYLAAARGYRQLAVVLRNQGMNDDADHYAYRAQLMQRVVLWRQAFLRGAQIRLWHRLRRLAAYVGSWILWALAGYGYRPGRSILAYLLLIGGFAIAYHTLGAPASHPAYHLSWLESIVVSLTAFHGRGFFAQQYSPGDPQSILAAGEAVVGLLVEITFIATFTNRFFAR